MEPLQQYEQTDLFPSRMFKVKLFCDRDSLKPRQDVECSDEALSCSTTPDSSLDPTVNPDGLRHAHKRGPKGLVNQSSRRDFSELPFDDSAAAECLLDLSSSEQDMSDSEQEAGGQRGLWLPEGGLYEALYNGITAQSSVGYMEDA